MSSLTSFPSGDIRCWAVDTSLCVKHCDSDPVDSERSEVVHHGGHGEALLKNDGGSPVRQD